MKDTVDLHVFVLSPHIWREDLQSAPNQVVDNAKSLGFVRVFPENSLSSLRWEIENQLSHGEGQGVDEGEGDDYAVPHNYHFLRHVGRSLARIHKQQEEQLQVKDFVPPQGSSDIYIIARHYGHRQSFKQGTWPENIAPARNLPTSQVNNFNKKVNTQSTGLLSLAAQTDDDVSKSRVPPLPSIRQGVHGGGSFESSDEMSHEIHKDKLINIQQLRNELATLQRHIEQLEAEESSRRLQEMHRARHGGEKELERPQRKEATRRPQTLQEKAEHQDDNNLQDITIDDQKAKNIKKQFREDPKDIRAYRLEWPAEHNIDELVVKLKAIREQNKDLASKRSELIRKIKERQHVIQDYNTHDATAAWKKRCLDEEKKRTLLEPWLEQLLQQMEELTEQIENDKLRTNNFRNVKVTKSMEKQDHRPSKENNLKIRAKRLTADIEILRRQIEETKNKVMTENQLRVEAEMKLRVSRSEAIEEKIAVTRSRNAKLANASDTILTV